MDARYQQKLALLFQSKENFTDPYQIPPEEWVDDPKKWPPVEFGQIYAYLIESPGLFTKEKLKAYKSLEAYNYYISGWVQTVYLYNIVDTSNCIMKAKVKPSQRMSEKPHNCWVGLQTTGDVLTAHCSCMAGCGETCSHIASILFKVEAFLRLEIGKESCTSLPCVWNQTFTDKAKPSRVHDICFFKPCHKKSESVIEKHKQGLDIRKETSPARSVPQLDRMKLLTALRNCSPKCAVFSLLPVIPGFCETDSSTIGDVPEPDDVNLPRQLFHLYNPAHSDLQPLELQKLVSETFDNLTITEGQSNFLEKSTQAQSNSYLWSEYRRGLITSSNFHSVLHFTGKKFPKSLVSTIMQYSSPNPDIPALKWGRSHEDEAFKKYVSDMKGHVNLKVRKSGLFINPSYPYLGASPDGIVNCDCCGKGVIEIKCPFKFKDMSPISDEALSDSHYCLQRDHDDAIQLSSKHSYYDQVQGQMAIVDVRYCDFICWTTKDVFVRRIQIEKDYGSTKFPVLKDFFITYMLPEILTHKLKLNTPTTITSNTTNTSTSTASTNSATITCNTTSPCPSTSTASTTCTSNSITSIDATSYCNSSPKKTRKRRTSATKDVGVSSSTTGFTSKKRRTKAYCFCKKELPGYMIACDNPFCAIEWFHYKCVNITQAPAGDWYCPHCKK